MLLINISITLVCAWGIAKVYNKIIRQVKINNYRFKMFDLRDRLTIIAMKGGISPTDKEYVTLLRLLNDSIQIFDAFTFVSFFKYLEIIFSDYNLQRNINRMINRLKTHSNKELTLIACQYFEITHEVFEKCISRTPLSLFIKVFFFVKYIKVRSEMAKRIDNGLEDNLMQLKEACA